MLYSLLSFRLFILRDRSITRFGFRDLAITACSAASSGDGNLCDSHTLCQALRRAENQRLAVVIRQTPPARLLQSAPERFRGSYQNCVHTVLGKGLVPTG